MALLDVLAELYPTTNDIRRITQDAGIDSRTIDFSGNALAVWASVLREVEKSNKYLRLIAVVASEYEESSALQDAIAQLLTRAPRELLAGPRGSPVSPVTGPSEDDRRMAWDRDDRVEIRALRRSLEALNETLRSSGFENEKKWIRFEAWQSQFVTRQAELEAQIKELRALSLALQNTAPIVISTKWLLIILFAVIMILAIGVWYFESRTIFIPPPSSGQGLE